MTATKSGRHRPRLVRRPIDEDTYKLLVVLNAKLDAVDDREADEPASAHEHERREDDDQRHAELLVDALRERLGTGPGARGRATR